MGKVSAKANLPLSKDEKLKFANAVLEARKNNPDLGWRALFNEGRKALKPGRMSKGIDHPSKLSWITPMLGITEVPKNKARANGKNIALLNDDDRNKFALAVFELRKEHPQASFKFLIAEANKILPTGKQFGSHIDSFHKISWIIPMLEKLENQKLPKKKSPLSLEDRHIFAEHFFEYKKANPGSTNLHAIRAANNALPEHQRIGARIDSVKQIPWIIPLLEKLENPPKAQSRWECKLTDKEKEQFTEIVYRLRKGGATWTRCMKEANTFMPEGHKIAASVSNPSGVPWLQRALAKLEEADKSKVVIDHRGTLPKTESEPEVKTKKQYKQNGAKLYLSDEDKQYFAEIVYQLRKANPGWGWQKILDEANSEMPAHKQRAHMPLTPSQILWLPPLLDEIGRRPPEKYIPDPAPVKIPEIATPAPAPNPIMDMQAMMMAAMEKVIRENMAAGGVMTMPAMMTAAPQVVKPEQPKRKKVIVVGLLEIQTQNIQKRFGHKFDFKFIGSNTPNQQIRDSMKNADIGILMTRFVSHPTQAAMRDHPGFTFCNGNSTALENLLEEKFARLDGQ